MQNAKKLLQMVDIKIFFIYNIHTIMVVKSRIEENKAKYRGVKCKKIFNLVTKS